MVLAALLTVSGAVLPVETTAQSVPARVAVTEYQGSAALGLALRRLGTTKRVLMIAAHPDDEATQVLSSLALGEGADVAYLSLTRGEGGQNGIGAELHEGLGLLRTGELLSARRLDGARQYFTRVIDYGFSKNSDEAFTQWPHDELLGDVVAVIRDFRPDVILSVFTGTPADGHGQHQAAGILAREAFEAAADPTFYPEQIARGLPAHAVTHFWQVGRGPADGPSLRLADGPVVSVMTGGLDPLMGQSHFQVAMASRSRHRSQDMGRALTPGPQATPLVLEDSRIDPGNDSRSLTSLFSGVDTTFSARGVRLMGGASGESGRLRDVLTRYQATIDDAKRVFNPLLPAQVVPFLTESARMLEEATRLVAERGEAASGDLAFQLAVEREQLFDALRRAARVELDAIASDETPVPGQTFQVELTLWNGGFETLAVTSLEPVLPAGWAVVARDALPESVEGGALVRRRFDVTVPTDAPVTDPYFLRLDRDGARYLWPDEFRGVGVPFEDPVINARAEVSLQRASFELSIPATFQRVDTRSGESRRPVRVVPAVSVTVGPSLVVVPVARRGEPVHLTVRLAGEEPRGLTGTLRIDAPAGWRVEPARVNLSFAAAGEERVLEFSVTPPADAPAGSVSLSTVFEDNAGRRFDRGYALVDYPHVEPRPLWSDARIEVRVIDVEVPAGLRVGYIGAAGDGVPAVLGQLGIDLRQMDEAELASAPLDVYNVIVVGSRAYEGRPDLIAHNQRLLDYVSAGGTMIVQYNQYQFTEPGLAPYPLSIARPHDRVTDENAAVTLLDPANPIFTSPNRLTDADFEGWVQERGLYHLNTWDSRYTPLMEMADPGEEPQRGMLMMARYGQGTYVYTGLALFRQLPAGVPGGWRLFANLLSLGAR
jgi:LmbE family N-acetylglucosaminyl deacetylase